MKKSSCGTTVSVYNLENDNDLLIYEFEQTDEKWLKCVAGHRKERLFKDELQKWKAFDIIRGKIANDTTNRVITNYINGDYGDPEELARRQKISRLSAFLKLMKSKTGEMLFDSSTDMWMNGPDYIADEYSREMYYKIHKKPVS